VDLADSRHDAGVAGVAAVTTTVAAKTVAAAAVVSARVDDVDDT